MTSGLPEFAPAACGTTLWLTCGWSIETYLHDVAGISTKHAYIALHQEQCMQAGQILEFCIVNCCLQVGLMTALICPTFAALTQPDPMNHI